MAVVAPDNGLLSVLYSILKREHYRQEGPQRDRTVAFMGACLIAMGATMVLRGLKKEPWRGR